MPAVNGVWLNNIPRGQKEIDALQKKATCYSFAHRTIETCKSGTIALLGATFLHNMACNIGEISDSSLSGRNVMLLRDTNSYSKQAITLLGGDPTEYEVNRGVEYLEYASMAVVAVGFFACTAVGPLNRLRNYFIRQHDNCISMIEASKKLQIPDYDDLQSYDQVVNIDKENVGPISCTPVEEIEQKVFYRGEVYEYYYLLTAYSNNPDSRDHTGQSYDISKIYRIDDNNIQYID